jgi:hypothetical protein
MSDREFDNYLTLLAGLLRLDGKQRQAIAEELRSHLEDRLDELTAGGVSREEAVRQALAEFGDAAGLAGQFVAISQHRKRRWLMRLTTFSVAATLLVAASLALLWPGRNAAPGAASVAAQDAKEDSKKPDNQQRQSPEPTLEERLNQRIDFKVVEIPLHQVFEDLGDQTGIQFVLKLKKLEEASVSRDTPVTKSLKRVRVSTLLELMLEDLELRYVDRDGLVLITTPEDAESRLQIHVYDCRDLLAMPAPPGADKFVTPPARPAVSGGMFAVEDNGPKATSPSPSGPQVAAPGGAIGVIGGAGGMGGISGRVGSTRPISEHDLRAERLMDIITYNVDVDSWAVVGGPGSISEYNGLIVVTQTAEVHKKVERLFDMLREAAGLEVPKTGKVVR